MWVVRKQPEASGWALQAAAVCHKQPCTLLSVSRGPVSIGLSLQTVQKHSPLPAMWQSCETEQYWLELLESHHSALFISPSQIIPVFRSILRVDSEFYWSFPMYKDLSLFSHLTGAILRLQPSISIGTNGTCFLFLLLWNLWEKEIFATATHKCFLAGHTNRRFCVVMLPDSSTQSDHVSQYIFPRVEVFLNHVHLIHFTIFLISVSIGGHPEVLLCITSTYSVHVTL